MRSFQNAFAIFDVDCFYQMFNLCKLIIMYSRAASNRVGWVGSFSPAKGPFVFFPPSRPGCSLAILGFVIGLVRGCHDFPSRQCREKDDRISLAFRIWLCLIYLFSPYSLWGILRLRTLEYIILQSSLGNKAFECQLFYFGRSAEVHVPSV